MWNQLQDALCCFVYPQFGESVAFQHFPVNNQTTARLRGFLREIDENCYAASNCDSLPMFRDNLSVPSSRKVSGTLKMRRTICPETSVRNFQYSLLVSPEVRSSNHTSVGDLRFCQLRWRRFNSFEIEERVKGQRFIGVAKKAGVFILGIKQSGKECDLEIKLRTEPR